MNTFNLGMAHFPRKRCSENTYELNLDINIYPKCTPESLKT